MPDRPRRDLIGGSGSHVQGERRAGECGGGGVHRTRSRSSGVGRCAPGWSLGEWSSARVPRGPGIPAPTTLARPPLAREQALR